MRALALVLLLAGCGEATPESPCLPGTHVDEARAQAIRARLATVEPGQTLLRAVGDRVRAICFAPATSASVIDDAHVVILASDLEEGEAAARLGHLLAHVRDGLPDRELVGPDCPLAVERALSREASAYVLEVELQDALAAAPRALAFEFATEVRAAPAGERAAIVLAYLRAHPNGAPGIDALAAGYLARCEAAR